jgi:hypothetical protein
VDPVELVNATFPPTFNLPATPRPPEVVIAPVVVLVETVVEVKEISPETVNEDSVPSDVTFGCAAVARVPLSAPDTVSEVRVPSDVTFGCAAVDRVPVTPETAVIWSANIDFSTPRPPCMTTPPELTLVESAKVVNVVRDCVNDTVSVGDASSDALAMRMLRTPPNAPSSIPTSKIGAPPERPRHGAMLIRAVFPAPPSLLT